VESVLKKLVYICHPLTGDGSPEWGDIDYNFERYLAFCEYAMDLGYAVLSWAHHVELHRRGLHKDHAYWLECDVSILAKADEVWFCGPLAVTKGMQIEYDANEQLFHHPTRHDSDWDDPYWFPPLERFPL